MPRYAVLLDVDGTEREEEVNGKDGVEAIRYAKQRHPIRVLEVRPLDEQLPLTPPVHPDQTDVDDFVDDGVYAAAEAADDFEYPEGEKPASAPAAGDLDDVPMDAGEEQEE